MNHRSYKFRLYPTREQTALLERSLDLCRELYNAALQERRDAWQLNRVRISFYDQNNQIPALRTVRPDLMLVQARVLMRTLMQVNATFQAFFRRVKNGERPGYPRFKSKSFFNSFTHSRTGFRFLSGKIQIGGIGLVKIKQHREIEGTIKEVTVKREGSKWFAVASCANVPTCPLPESNAVVGVDVGIESFATLSDGTQIENWRYYERTAKKLRVAQRRVARRKKGSHRRRKAVAILRNIHSTVVNQRADFQHKTSTRLIQNHDLIAVENLNIKGLAKMRLAKQVLDASWSSFIFMLRYKAESAGRKLVEVDPRWTSQDCSACGERVKKALSVRLHHCLSCGLSLHRDHNAALNILSRGLRDQDLTWAATPCVS